MSVPTIHFGLFTTLCYYLWNQIQNNNLDSDNWFRNDVCFEIIVLYNRSNIPSFWYEKGTKCPHCNIVRNNTSHTCQWNLFDSKYTKPEREKKKTGIIFDVTKLTLDVKRTRNSIEHHHEGPIKLYFIAESGAIKDDIHRCKRCKLGSSSVNKSGGTCNVCLPKLVGELKTKIDKMTDRLCQPIN